MNQTHARYRSRRKDAKMSENHIGKKELLGVLAPLREPNKIGTQE